MLVNKSFVKGAALDWYYNLKTSMSAAGSANTAPGRTAVAPSAATPAATATVTSTTPTGPAAATAATSRAALTTTTTATTTANVGENRSLH